MTTNAKFAFDASGNVKQPSSQQLTEADENTAILAYSNGKTEDGRPYYAYLAVKPSKYEEFYRRSAAKETFPLGQYGLILVSDFAVGPPPEVIKYMKETFGFDENYEQGLKKEIKLQQDAFLQGEKKRLDDIVNMMKKNDEDKK
jgi:hypothetical protein